MSKPECYIQNCCEGTYENDESAPAAMGNRTPDHNSWCVYSGGSSEREDRSLTVSQILDLFVVPRLILRTVIYQLVERMLRVRRPAALITPTVNVVFSEGSHFCRDANDGRSRPSQAVCGVDTPIPRVTEDSDQKR